jgi:hypothetical protein
MHIPQYLGEENLYKGREIEITVNCLENKKQKLR